MCKDADPCPVCGEMMPRFASSGRSRKFCGANCRKKAGYKKASHRKECASCGDEFNAGNALKKYCSDACSRKAKYQRNNPAKTQKCSHCSSDFTTTSRVKKYCSKECSDSARRNASREKRKSGWSIRCAECSTVFNAKRRTYKFCSDRCKAKSAEKRMPSSVCTNCGSEFRYREYGRAGKYCSRECSFEHQKSSIESRVLEPSPLMDPQPIGWKNWCVVCGVEFESKGPIPKTCTSDKCKKHFNKVTAMAKDVMRSLFLPERRECKVCGDMFFKGHGEKSAKTCSLSCRRELKRITKSKSRQIRRAKKKKVPVGEKVSRREIFMRDDYECQLCGVITDPRLHVNHDNYPELDHDIPISAGGSHTEVNLQCLCRRCNQDKGDSMPQWVTGSYA